MLKFRDKIFVVSLAIVILASFLSWIGYLFIHFTKTIPAKGGQYSEGIVGQPMYINPLLSQTSEADADLVQLIYSGLLKYDSRGSLVNNLAESYEISPDQKIYTFHIKQNIKWHDGEPLTASDVLFTINAVQDPAYKSPLRQSWQGIEVSQKDEYAIEFVLENPYFGFLNNLTLGILPKHAWENISPEKFSLADSNLHPVGSGPYQFFDFQKDSGGNILSFTLRSFRDYFEGQPYIPEITFNFYPDDESIVTAYDKKEISGMGNVTAEKISAIKSPKSTRVYELNVPHYFALFLNRSKSVPLADDKVREALAYGVDRREIIEKILNGKGTAVYSPFMPQMNGYGNDISKYDFSVDKAREILEEDGWKLDGDETARAKNDVKLEFEIFTLDNPQLMQTADILRDQWGKIGADVRVNVLSVSDLQQKIIRPREYNSLLFGQAVSFSPDPYSFWHSSQKKDPGLNLSLFDDKKADELLDKARQEPDGEKRAEYYKEFQKIVVEEVPAIFLYSPSYLYPVSQKVQGISAQNVNAPSWRFGDVNDWYIKKKRVWK